LKRRGQRGDRAALRERGTFPGFSPSVVFWFVESVLWTNERPAPPPPPETRPNSPRIPKLLRETQPPDTCHPTTKKPQVLQSRSSVFRALSRSRRGAVFSRVRRGAVCGCGVCAGAGRLSEHPPPASTPRGLFGSPAPAAPRPGQGWRTALWAMRGGRWPGGPGRRAGASVFLGACPPAASTFVRSVLGINLFYVAPARFFLAVVFFFFFLFFDEAPHGDGNHILGSREESFAPRTFRIRSLGFLLVMGSWW
jgi:hypothetical protein